jgi:hypothetical protein
MKYLLSIALLLMSASSRAATTIYTDQASFESQIVTSIVDDYEMPSYDVGNRTNAAMNAVLNETKYVPTYWSNNRVYIEGSNQAYCAGCNGSYRLDFTSTSISHGIGVDAVAFEFFNDPFNLGNTQLFFAFVQFGDGSTENYALPFANYQAVLTGYWGIISDKRIATIHFGLPDGGFTRSGSFGHDNLTIGRVPEPSSIVLAVGSSVLLAFHRQR